VRWFDVFDDEETFRDQPLVSVLLKRWASHPSCRRVLLDLFRENCPGVASLSPADPAAWRGSLPYLEEEFRRLRLVLVRPKRVIVLQRTGVLAPDDADRSRLSLDDILAASKQKQAAIQAREDARRAAKQKTWIAIRLKDKSGRPLSGERYRVTLTDGSVCEGVLDQRGEAWFRDIDPGKCQVSFPDIDHREWNAA